MVYVRLIQGGLEAPAVLLLHSVIGLHPAVLLALLRTHLDGI